MLAVLLGASTFPNSPKLAEGRAFYLSAADVREYLLEEGGLALPRRNTLSLFDDSRSPSDQLMEVANFLLRRTLEMKNEGVRAEDLLIYYVGHGLFTRGDQAYCLAVRSTNELNEGATSIRAGDLAGVVKENAAFLRKYIILDCCFAGSIHKEFQSGALGAARVQIANEFPARGTALLCSSNAREASLAPQGLQHTMFTDALIRSLRSGHPACGPRLSFSELGEVIQENLRSEYPERWVRPEVHSPDQREGDIAHLPLFPNPAYGQREADQLAAELAARKKVEADRLAQAAAAERAAREKAEAKRVAQAAAAERAAREKAESERQAQVAAAERAAREKAEAKRVAQAAAAERAVREKAERSQAEEAKRTRAQQNAEQERNARSQAGSRQIVGDKAFQEKVASRNAETVRLTREKAERQRTAQTQATVNPSVREKAFWDELASRNAAAVRTAREKADAKRLADVAAAGRGAAQARTGLERTAQRQTHVDPSGREKTFLEEVASRNAEAVRAARKKAAAVQLAANRAASASGRGRA